jgi:phosphate-selective porin OprO/OprP
MNAFRPAFSAALILAVAFAGSHSAQAQSRDDDIQALREQIRQLDQKLRILERKSELKDEENTAAAKAAPKLTAADGRVEVASSDGATSLRLRGLVQGDFRAYDSANDAAHTFLLRRARLIFEGRFNKIFQYVVQPEFGGTVQILDAYANAAFSPAVQLRVGKFKTPLGLEQLQSDPVAFFNERSVATGLTPNRDTGLQVHGDLLENRLNYAVGVFNGVPDGGNNVTGGTDFDNNKTFVARLFATPFVNDKESLLSGLGFGIAASVGDFETVAGRAANYRTDGQQNFFTYLTSTTVPGDNVVAVGEGLTYSPQAYFYRGPFGLLAEYVVSSIEVQRGAGRIAEVNNYAYNLSAGYVLTGEDLTYRGVSPKNNFNPSAGTWGAFEVVARIAGVDIDDTVFTGPSTLRLANPNVSATELTTYGLGLNWYLSKSVRAGFNVFQNEFKLAPQAAPAANALISDDETTFISRLQLTF